MGVQGEEETGLVLETAEEEEVEAVAEEVVAVGVVEWGQAVGNPRVHHLETGDPVVGWETAPSVLA